MKKSSPDIDNYPYLTLITPVDLYYCHKFEPQQLCLIPPTVITRSGPEKTTLIEITLGTPIISSCETCPRLTKKYI